MIPIHQSNSIHYLLGDNKLSIRPLIPYDPLLCNFLEELSSELRSSPETARYPDIIAFAFWCRKANILKLKEIFEDNKIRLGLGLAFHIAPSNVPINFAFSFAFALLAGNANIVRVPSKSFLQVDLVCHAIDKLLENEKYKEIKTMTAFVRYEQNDQITGDFSASCNARIIWGGDESIRNIRQLPIPERSIEIAFSDRYSFCMIDAPSILKLQEEELKRLTENFYNDTYLMDQNACSSPHLIVWQGEEKEKAKQRFWTALSKIVVGKYPLAPVHAVDKYALLCRDAIALNNIQYFKQEGVHIYRIGFNRLPLEMSSFRGKYGYFYEYDMEKESDISPIINKKYQTLTYFGIDKALLQNFVLENRLTGIDRIVPVGQALDIGPIWDGYDVVKSLSRIIDVR